MPGSPDTSVAKKISPFLISFAITSVFFINFCAWIFRCGCHSLWSGAAAMCNIHAAHGHHCPWCSHGHAGEALIMVLLCAPQLAVALMTRSPGVVETVSVAAAVVALPLGLVKAAR